jgi:hypothetical protein
MRCRASKMLCRGRKTSLKLDKCRGPQRMSMVCRETWVVVEFVEPPWEIWTPYKFVENVADQWI